MNMINRTLSLLLMALLISACTSSTDDAMQPIQALESGDYRVELLAEDGALSAGTNAIGVRVLQNGNAVAATDASLVFSMPAMGTMPYMESSATVAPVGDDLSGTIDLSMGGGWNVQMDVQTPSGPLRGTFRVQVQE